MRDVGDLFKIVVALEEGYETDIPLLMRLQKIGKALETVDKIIAVDRVLLVWSASARLLYRLKAYNMAFLCFDSYRSLSLKLSNGRDPDVLRLLSDLLVIDLLAA